jgi:2'-5' RNA ligase
MSGDAIRAFLAVPIPETVRQRVARVLSALKYVLPDGRFVNPDQMHLTLHFFASLEPGRVTALAEAARAATAETAAFDLVLGGLGVFPDTRKPRVLWLGLREGADGLADLARDVGDRAREAGLPVEDRPLKPHLTLCRFRFPERAAVGLPAAFRKAGDAGPERFRVERLVLYRSELQSQGALHTAIGEFPLSG